MYKTAVGKPQDMNGVSVTEHFRDKLVRDNVVLVPHEFTFSGDPSKALGEQAEKFLFDLVSKCKDTWVLKTRVIEKIPIFFVDAKFSQIARGFQKFKS